MAAEERGSFIISCRQIEVDGVSLADPAGITLGAAWRWSGRAARVETARDLPHLAPALVEVDVRRRAARQVRRLLGSVVAIEEAPQFEPPPPPEPVPGTDGVLTVSDGYRSYSAILIGAGARQGGYAIFVGRLPPERTSLRVTALDTRSAPRSSPLAGARGDAGLPDGTLVATVAGPRKVEDLRPGDRIETRDNGPVPLLWKGRALARDGELVRLLPNAFAPGVPWAPVLLAPLQRVLVSHPSARTLFGAREVLVAARDLVDQGFARLCLRPDGARMHRLLFERHQVIWAAGVPCESLNPAEIDLSDYPAGQVRRLKSAAPLALIAPETAGPTARRVLGRGEAAMLFSRPPVARLGS